MRYIYKLMAILLFLLVLGFALKNNAPVELRYYLGIAWRAPLSLILLISFFAGTLMGIAAFLSSFTRQRREIIALKREIKSLDPDNNTL